MKKFNRLIIAVGITALFIGALAACSSGNSATAEPAGDVTDKLKVVAATSGAPSPYIYNVDGTLYGYDVEVLEEVFSRLPQYELEWEVTEFASILTGIDAGYYQRGTAGLY